MGKVLNTDEENFERLRRGPGMDWRRIPGPVGGR